MFFGGTWGGRVTPKPDITVSLHPLLYDKLLDVLWGTIRDNDWHAIAAWELDLFSRLLDARESK